MLASAAWGGPYSQAFDDPTNPFDAPIAGLIGVDINPEFVGWATGYVDYLPTANVDPSWQTPGMALGPATGDQFDVVTLGDLTQSEINDSDPVGTITMLFDTPIRNGVGADFAVFENGLVQSATAIFAELAYVEVSSTGEDDDFARFESDSLTASPVWTYGTIDPTDVYNLAGKHKNNADDSWGTPFDLSELAGHALVQSGVLDLQAVTHVRLMDIPGTGDFLDGDGDPVYDAWLTYGSSGFDLEALGVLNERPDYDGDGDVDADDVDILCDAVAAASDDLQYDMDNDGDVDEDDMVTMIETAVEVDIDGDDVPDLYGSFQGDFNLDGTVDIADLAVLRTNSGQAGMGYADGNANCDDLVDLADLTILRGTAGSSVSPVPEPASTGLLLLGGGALLRWRRGQRRSG